MKLPVAKPNFMSAIYYMQNQATTGSVKLRGASKNKIYM